MGVAILSMMLIAIVAMKFGSIANLWVERTDPSANITTAADALWADEVSRPPLCARARSRLLA